MSEVFQGYERQYCEISASLSRRCTAAAAALDGEQKKQKVNEIKSGLDDAESLIRKMDLEARSLQPSVRAGLLAKLREYKSDLNNLKGELKRISAVVPKPGAREDLLESGMSNTLVFTPSAVGSSRDPRWHKYPTADAVNCIMQYSRGYESFQFKMLL